jgi:hypothetical protein
VSLALSTKTDRVPDRTQSSRPSPRHVVLGSALVVAGIAWLADAAGWVEVAWAAAPALALIAAGAALVVGARRPHHGVLIALGIVLVFVQAAIAAVDVPVRGGVGGRLARPVELAALRSPYRLIAGEQTLDLTALTLPTGTTEVEVSVTMGKIRVAIPQDVSLMVEGQVGVGQIVVLGEEQTLVDHRTTVRVDVPASDRRLLLRLSVGMGKIEVQQ